MTPGKISTYSCQSFSSFVFRFPFRANAASPFLNKFSFVIYIIFTLFIFVNRKFVFFIYFIHNFHRFSSELTKNCTDAKKSHRCSSLFITYYFSQSSLQMTPDGSCGAGSSCIFSNTLYRCNRYTASPDWLPTWN